MTLGNADGEIGGLTSADPPTQPEVQALRDSAEELADDVRALAALVHALRTSVVSEGLVKDGAWAVGGFSFQYSNGQSYIERCYASS